VKGRATRTPPRTAVRRLALARAISETGSAAACGDGDVGLPVVMFLMGFGDAMSEVADQGIRQRRTPDAVRSRLIASMESLVHLAIAVAYVLAAGALALLSPQGAYGPAGVSSLAAVLLLWPTVRRLRGGPGRSRVEPHVLPSIGDPT
jgi:hypothetical protein